MNGGWGMLNGVFFGGGGKGEFVDGDYNTMEAREIVEY